MNKKNNYLNNMLFSVIAFMLFSGLAHAAANLTVASVTTTPANGSGYISTSVTVTANATDYTGIFTSAILTFDGTNYTMYNTTANVTNSSSGVSFRYVVPSVLQGYHTLLVTITDSNEVNQSTTNPQGYSLVHPYTPTYVSSDLGLIPFDFLGWLFASFVSYATLAALAVLVLGIVWFFGKGV